MRTIYAVMERNIITKLRAYPYSFFLGGILTKFYLVLASYLIFNHLYDGKVSEKFIKYANIDDYMTYVIIGASFYMFIRRTILSVSRSFITEMREGTLESLLITPMKYTSYLIGNMLEQSLLTFLEVILAFIICIPFGFKISSVNGEGIILTIILSLYSFFGLSIFICALMIQFKDTYIIQNTFFYLLAILAGIYFPIDYLPKKIQLLSNLLPVTYSMSLFRGMLMEKLVINNILGIIFKLLLSSSIYLIIGWVILKVYLKKAVSNQFI